MDRTPPERVTATQAEACLGILDTVLAAVAAGRPADAVLQDLYARRREFGSRDRRLYSGLVFAFFRWKGWLALAPALPLARRAAAAWHLDGGNTHPAIDRLALLPGPAEPLDTLEAKARQAARWLDLPAPPPAAALVQADALPLLEREDLVESFQVRPPTWIRVRRGAEGAVADACRSLDMAPVPHPRLSQAWRMPDRARIADLMARAGGSVEIQDIASQAAGLVAAPAPGGRWWDVCAGAGGKSLHLADLCGGNLHLVATDIRPAALEEAARRARKAGVVRAIRFRTGDALSDPLPKGGFDGVLVDAPCSGSGTWSRNPDARWRWSAASMAEFTRAQSAILARAAGAVKPGGTLVYVTCSLFRPENGDITKAFLTSHPEFQPAPFENPLTGKPESGAAVLWPWDGPGSGMFVARMVKMN